MKTRNVVLVLGAGVVAALVGRMLTTSKAPAPPAPPTPPSRVDGIAHVTVYDDGNPAADRWVVFHDAAGAVTAKAKTDKDGKASGGVANGGMVTVVVGDSVFHLFTVMGVMANDEIVAGDLEKEGGEAKTACTALVTIPEKVPGAVKHVVDLGTGVTEISEAGRALPIGVRERFLVAGKFRVLAEALDDKGNPLAWTHAWIAGCPNDGGVVAAPLPAWSKKYKSFTFDVQNARGPLSGDFSLLTKAEDRFARGHREGTPLVFLAPEPLGSDASYKLSMARCTLRETREDLAEKTTIDARDRFLAPVSDVLVGDETTARPNVRWRVDDGGPKPDAVVVRLAWPKTREHVWTIALAPDAPRRIVVPQLPEELATWRPNGSALTAAVATIEASFYDGFRDVAKKGLGLLEEPPEADVVSARWCGAGEIDF